MKPNQTPALSLLLIFIFLPSEAAINLRMFNDPRNVQFKNIFKQRHTSGECGCRHEMQINESNNIDYGIFVITAASCPPADISVLESQQLFHAAGVSVINSILYCCKSSLYFI